MEVISGLQMAKTFQMSLSKNESQNPSWSKIIERHFWNEWTALYKNTPHPQKNGDTAFKHFFYVCIPLTVCSYIKYNSFIF